VRRDAASQATTWYTYDGVSFRTPGPELWNISWTGSKPICWLEKIQSQKIGRTIWGRNERLKAEGDWEEGTSQKGRWVEEIGEDKMDVDTNIPVHNWSASGIPAPVVEDEGSWPEEYQMAGPSNHCNRLQISDLPLSTVEELPIHGPVKEPVTKLASEKEKEKDKDVEMVKDEEVERTVIELMEVGSIVECIGSTSTAGRTSHIGG
jgi:hypothetical protein